MPRKPDLNKKNRYFDPFPERLRILMDKHGTSQEEIKTILHLKNRQSVTGYVDGSTVPTAEKIRAIAEYYHVSTDYLLGLSDTEKTEYSFFSEESGFSNETVENLIYLGANGNPGLIAARRRASFEMLINSGVLFSIVERLQDYLDIKTCENENTPFDVDYFLKKDKEIAKETSGQFHIIASGWYAKTFQVMASSDLSSAFEKIADSIGKKWHSYMPRDRSINEKKQEMEDIYDWRAKTEKIQAQKWKEWERRIAKDGKH